MEINTLNQQLPDLLKNSQMRLSFEWKEHHNQYGSSSTRLYLGKLLVCSFHYNNLGSRGSNKMYKVFSEYKTLLNETDFETEEQAAEMCVQVGRRFLFMIKAY